MYKAILIKVVLLLSPILITGCTNIGEMAGSAQAAYDTKRMEARYEAQEKYSNDVMKTSFNRCSAFIEGNDDLIRKCTFDLYNKAMSNSIEATKNVTSNIGYKGLTNQSSGQKVYRADECVGAVVNGVCHGSIIPKGGYRPTCHGQMLNGQCTGPMF